MKCAFLFRMYKILVILIFGLFMAGCAKKEPAAETAFMPPDEPEVSGVSDSGNDYSSSNIISGETVSKAVTVSQNPELFTISGENSVVFAGYNVPVPDGWNISGESPHSLVFQSPEGLHSLFMLYGGTDEEISSALEEYFSERFSSRRLVETYGGITGMDFSIGAGHAYDYSAYYTSDLYGAERTLAVFKLEDFNTKGFAAVVYDISGHIEEYNELHTEIIKGLRDLIYTQDNCPETETPAAAPVSVTDGGVVQVGSYILQIPEGWGVTSDLTGKLPFSDDAPNETGSIFVMISGGGLSGLYAVCCDTEYTELAVQAIDTMISEYFEVLETSSVRDFVNEQGWDYVYYYMTARSRNDGSDYAILRYTFEDAGGGFITLAYTVHKNNAAVSDPADLAQTANRLKLK